jgi:hypothetical protein
LIMVRMCKEMVDRRQNLALQNGGCLLYQRNEQRIQHPFVHLAVYTCGDLACADVFAVLAEGLGSIKLSGSTSCRVREAAVKRLGCFEACKNSFDTPQRTHILLLLEMSLDDVREIMIVYFENHTGHVN